MIHSLFLSVFLIQHYYILLEPLILTLYPIQFIAINANNNKLHLLCYKICFRFELHSVYTIFALS